jgi:hypothetical protein
MRLAKYSLAMTEVLLIFPAALFMAALFLRNVQPEQYQPAHLAGQIVLWYAARTKIGLWLLLITLPLVVLVTGGAALLRRWSEDRELRQAAKQTFGLIKAYFATVMIASATVAAGGILAIVALHVLTD